MGEDRSKASHLFMFSATGARTLSCFVETDRAKAFRQWLKPTLCSDEIQSRFHREIEQKARILAAEEVIANAKAEAQAAQS